MIKYIIQQVVRYSALVSGIFYGIFHRQTLQAQYDSHQAANEVHKREEWLKKAKEAWAAKTATNDGREFVRTLGLSPSSTV